MAAFFLGEKLTLEPKFHSLSMLPLGKYQHYKGKFYQVIGVATHSETLETLVVYQKLYDDHSLWVRPLAMFIENVVVAGVEVPRFRWVGE